MSDTPRSNAACALCHGFGIEAVDDSPTRFVSLDFARKLERELTAATAELAATKEQLRVALSGIASAISQMDRHNDWNAYQILLTLTQPNLSADSPEGGNPAKGKGGVPSTFPA